MVMAGHGGAPWHLHDRIEHRSGRMEHGSGCVHARSGRRDEGLGGGLYRRVEAVEAGDAGVNARGVKVWHEGEL